MANLMRRKQERIYYPLEKKELDKEFWRGYFTACAGMLVVGIFIWIALTNIFS